jgi:GNAT superfamily N-acetyltransferase
MLSSNATTESQRKVVLKILEQLASYHPSVPHWHLALLGVDPVQQNCGYGSLLMGPPLETCDGNGHFAYLESTNIKNLPFYRRHGFDLLGTIQVDTAPPVYPMLRRPSSH